MIIPEPPWQVINRGVPGNDSVDLVERLPEFLESMAPDVVCILVGYNDRWRTRLDREVELPPLGAHPERSTAPTFEWRWRTLQLLARLTTREPTAPGPNTAARNAALIGTWHAPATTPPMRFVFDGDGRLRIGDAVFHWRGITDSASGGRRIGLRAEGQPELPVTWRRADNRLLLEGGAWSEAGPLTLEPGPPPASPLEHARQALRSRELALVESLLPEPPLSLDWLQVKIEWLHARSDTEEVEAHLAELSASFDRPGTTNDAERDLAARSALVGVCLRIGKVDRALRCARVALERNPNAGIGPGTIWGALAPWANQDRARGRRILPLLSATLAHPSTTVAARAAALGTRARIRFQLAEDPVSTLRDAILSDQLLADRQRSSGSTTMPLAHRETGSTGSPLATTAGFLASRPGLFPPQVITAVRNDARLTEATRRQLDALVHAVADAPSDHATQLERRLRHCVDLAEHHGARVLLLTYPEPMRLNPVAREIAATTGAELVDLTGTFAEATRGTPRSRWFIADGHCNDRGYALIATAVAQHVQGR